MLNKINGIFSIYLGSRVPVMWICLKLFFCLSFAPVRFRN